MVGGRFGDPGPLNRRFRLRSLILVDDNAMARTHDDEYDDEPDRRPRRRRRRDEDDYDDYDDYDDEEDPGPPPPNYLVPSILVTLCCCTIGGIVAIVSASQVNPKWARGDYSGAYQASEKAKLWCWMSFAIGLVLNIILAAIEIAKEQNAGN